MAVSDPAPPELVDVIRCQCKADGKKCSSMSCSCHKQHLTCTPYCNCCGGERCYNPYSRIATTQADQEMEETEEQAADQEMEETEEHDWESVEGNEDIEEQTEENNEYDFETEYFAEETEN